MDILDLDDELVQARTTTSTTVDSVDDVLVQNARHDLTEAEERMSLARDGTDASEEAEALHGWRMAKMRLAQRLASNDDGRPEACLIFQGLLEQEIPQESQEQRASVTHKLADVFADMGQYSDSLALLDTLISDHGRDHGVQHPVTHAAVVHRREVSLRHTAAQSGVFSGSRIMASLYTAAESGSFEQLRTIRMQLASSSNAPAGFMVPESLAFYAAMH